MNFLSWTLVYVLITLKLSSAVDLSKLDSIPMPPDDTNETFKLLTVRGPSPIGLVILFMEETGPPLIFNFTVKCKDKESRYTLRTFSEDPALVIVTANDTFIDCAKPTPAAVPFTLEMSSLESSYNIKNEPNEIQGSTSVQFKADMIGRTFISFILFNDTELVPDGSLFYEVKFPVTIFRKLRIIDHAFQVVVYIFIIFITLAFGCKLDLTVVKEILKRPIAPCIGMGCQFVIMPMVGYAIAKIVTPDKPDVALGIFVCGCCPGGGASNIYSHLLGGDLSLSITMTAISTVLAIGMMPLWIYTLGTEFTDNTVTVPFTKIFTTLLILILPLLVGIFRKYKLPNLKKFLMKIITPITVICIILLLTVGIYSNLYIFKLFKPQIVLAGCLLPYCGYVLGLLCAVIFRLPWERAKTVGIETGMQNISIALVLMMYAFPPPDGFIAAVAPMASGIMTPIPLFLITIPYLIYRRCNKEKYENVSTDQENKEEKKENNLADITFEVENGNIIKK